MTATSRGTPSSAVNRKRGARASARAAPRRRGSPRAGAASPSRSVIEKTRSTPCGELAGVGEGAAEELLGGLVVEDEVPRSVGDKGGRGQLRCELPRENTTRFFCGRVSIHRRRPVFAPNAAASAPGAGHTRRGADKHAYPRRHERHPVGRRARHGRRARDRRLHRPRARRGGNARRRHRGGRRRQVEAIAGEIGGLAL